MTCGLAVDRDAKLLHDFQQRRVRFRGERLISSASKSCVKTGPGRKRNSWVFMSKIGAPVISEGIKSAVN